MATPRPSELAAAPDPPPAVRAAATTRRRRAWRRDARRRRLLAGADALGVLALLLAFGTTSGSGLGWIGFVVGAMVLSVLVAKALGLYDQDHRLLWHSTPDEMPQIAIWAALVTGAIVITMRAAGDELPSAVALVGFWLGLTLLGAGLRAAARKVWQQTTPPERIVLIGSGPLEQAARRKFLIFGDLHVELMPSIHENEVFTPERRRGGFTRLEELGDSVDRVLVAAASVDEHLISELVPFCRSREIKLGLIPPARGMFGTAVTLDHLAELPIVQYNTWDVSRTTLLCKRGVDVVVALAGLLVTVPFLPFAALLIRLDSPGPVFFRQKRGGQGGRPFRMLKFRTMHADAEARLHEVVDVKALEDPVFKIEGDPRITRAGKYLRRTSLDELPQLWNVLRGDMSLVGPRPEQVELVERYPEEVRLVRLAVKPGLTGPMQIYGRGQLTLEERLAVEREYVENLSIARDLRILGRTASAVFAGRGAF